MIHPYIHPFFHRISFIDLQCCDENVPRKCFLFNLSPFYSIEQLSLNKLSPPQFKLWYRRHSDWCFVGKVGFPLMYYTLKSHLIHQIMFIFSPIVSTGIDSPSLHISSVQGRSRMKTYGRRHPESISPNRCFHRSSWFPPMVRMWICQA